MNLYERMRPHYSRQENFIINILNEKQGGTYVELGAYHSRENSNTFHLETDFGWSGVSFEVSQERRDEFNSQRKNPCLGDALTFNYIDYFQNNDFPKQIDFLQVDIDDGGPEHNTSYAGLHALIALPLTVYRFTIITFEHDANMYFRNAVIRDVQREILDSLGYSLVIRDIHEDYWVDSRIIKPEMCRDYRSKEYLEGMQVNYS